MNPRFFSILLSALLLSPGWSTLAAAPEDEALANVKRMVGFIRYERNEAALQVIGTEAITEYLMGGHYAQATEEQKEKFGSLLGEYIALKAFPQALEYFKDIDLSYDQPQTNGDRVNIRSTILYGGSEQISFTWVLEEVGDEYRVVDFLDQDGKSSMETNRDRVIQPLLERRGIPGTLEQMEKAVEQLR